MCAPVISLNCPIHTSYTFDTDSHCTWILLIQPGWLSSLRNPPDSTSPALDTHRHTSFLCGCPSPNSGPQGCTASTLPTEYSLVHVESSSSGSNTAVNKWDIPSSQAQQVVCSPRGILSTLLCVTHGTVTMLLLHNIYTVSQIHCHEFRQFSCCWTGYSSIFIMFLLNWQNTDITTSDTAVSGTAISILGAFVPVCHIAWDYCWTCARTWSPYSALQGPFRPK